MAAASFFHEARRRGVPGAMAGYLLAVGGMVELADVMTKSWEMPDWTMKGLLTLALLGLPVIAVVSWTFDVTRHGLVRTAPPALPPPEDHQRTLPSPMPAPLRPIPAGPLDEAALSAGGLLAGRYVVEREIGRGGMGRVLAARDQKLGRAVAIKVLTEAFEPRRVARFEVEARAAGGLLHPNVLGIYDIGDHFGTPFLVCELLDGRNLRHALEKGALPPQQALSFSQQLARGLGAAHAQGVIHRDLKPENLFITRAGVLKILDFGLAKLAESEPGQQLTPSGSIFGTPGYLSPEQARGDKADARSDIFAAGAVIYEMLSGTQAFPGTTLVEAGVSALTREPAPLPPNVPPPLVDVVRKALQKDPLRRYANGHALAQALETIDLGGAGPRRPRAAAPTPQTPAAASPPPKPIIDPDAIAARLRSERIQSLESGVELAEHSDEDAPFRRCAICEADSNRAAVKCGSCGARLDTPDQEAFNRAYWAKRRADESAT